MLEQSACRGNVEVMANTSVTSVGKDTCFRVETSRGVMESKALVATGGLSIPKMGVMGSATTSPGSLGWRWWSLIRSGSPGVE